MLFYVAEEVKKAKSQVNEEVCSLWNRIPGI